MRSGSGVNMRDGSGSGAAEADFLRGIVIMCSIGIAGHHRGHA
jgi:hypothetical protein